MRNVEEQTLKNATNKPKARSTDWKKLRRMKPAEIRRGILADPDAHPTDAAFWKNAKVVMRAAPKH